MQLWRPLLALAVALPVAGCKDGTEEVANASVNEEDIIVAPRSPRKEFYADARPTLRDSGDFFFAVWDDGFTTVLDDLPDEGEVPADKRPTSGYWYPENLGGTNVDVSATGRTPLAKYDEAFHGGQSKAVKWEQENHSTNGGQSTYWYGHCNGFAAAAQRHPKPPEREVVRNGVVFTPKDIRALLAEVYMNAKFKFLGGWRFNSGDRITNPNNRDDPTVMGSYEDVNPATMHAAIANWIGRKKHTIIMDQAVNDEVWNYPFKFSSNTTMLIESRPRQLVTRSFGGAYIFNPDAVKFTWMRTRITYADAIGPSGGQPRESVDGSTNPKTMDLTYILELNARGEIIGGEWTGQSQGNHPDFVWVALEPFSGNDTQFFANPEVDADRVIRMWAESAGFDPDNPPLDIMAPTDLDTWGKWPDFSAVLDGSRRGAVFAGKDVTLKVMDRKNNVADSDLSLELILNGEKVETLSGAGDLSYKFTPGPGLSRMQLVWLDGSSEIRRESLRFMVTR